MALTARKVVWNQRVPLWLFFIITIMWIIWAISIISDEWMSTRINEWLNEWMKEGRKEWINDKKWEHMWIIRRTSIYKHFSSGISTLKPCCLAGPACLLFLAAANLPWESAAPFGDTASSTPLEVRLNQILVATRVLLWFSTTPEVSLTALKNDGWKINLLPDGLFAGAKC